MQRRLWSLALTGILGIAGAACSADGSVDGTGGDDPGDAPGDDPGPNPDPTPTCNETVPIPVTQQQKVPDVLLVLDKSGSMGEELDVGGEKMTVMKEALKQVLPAQDASLHLGLLLYPSGGECGVGSVLTPVAPTNAAAVLAAVDPVDPGGATPTYKALDAALAYYKSNPVNPDGRYVLLATDGLPNCNGSASNPSNAQTVASAKALAAAGIQVFVVGFGDVGVADPEFLGELAKAGGTGQFFPANSPQQLTAALAKISGTISQASCSFQLGSTPQDPSLLGVTVDGQVVKRDPTHASGWDYDAATNTITLYGATCDAVKKGGGAAKVDVDYGCGVITVD
jgi:hypothetical protein